MRLSHASAALAATCLLTTSAAVHAQTTDPKAIADARELANAGMQAQNERRYADCTAKFSAAHKLYPEATTVTIRLAQCLVAEGKLVEGSEAYRELANTRVPADAPAPFKDAQARGKSEAEQVNALVPTLTIAVDPTPPPAGTQLHMQRNNPNGPPTVEVLDAAWIGTARKVNPGEYTVFATAPGYASKTQQVSLTQGKKESARLLLSAGEAAPVVAGTETHVAGPDQQQPPEPYQQQPAPTPTGQATKLGLLLGLGGGVSVGGVEGIGGGELGPMGHLNLYMRISKFVVGGVLQYDALRDSEGAIGAGYVGIHAGLLTTAERKVAFWMDGGVGVRFINGTEDANQGFSLQLGLGPSFPLARVVRLIPKGYFGVGGTSNAAFGLAGLSLDLQFEIPLGKKPTPPPTSRLAPNTWLADRLQPRNVPAPRNVQAPRDL